MFVKPQRVVPQAFILSFARLMDKCVSVSSYFAVVAIVTKKKTKENPPKIRVWDCPHREIRIERQEKPGERVGTKAKRYMVMRADSVLCEKIHCAKGYNAVKARNEKGDLTERKTSCDKRKNLATSKYLLPFPLQLKLESVFTFSLDSRYSIVVAITTAVSTATTASGIQNRHRFPFSYAFAVSLTSIPPSSESQRQRAAS